MAEEGFRRLPDDVFVQILVLLPTSSRRRFRLVCKRWRDMINERTPERQVGTNVLAFIRQQRSCSRALVFDNKDWLRRHAWMYPCSHERSKIDMVGTCNGLLCLHEIMASSNGGSFFSAITVTNPITGETLALPPAPRSWEWEQVRSPGKYSFGYHPTTGRYKVVHIPCGRRQAVDALQVFTLGDTAWREVPVDTWPGATYNRLYEPISVDGRTYWLDAFSHRVMELDLEDERVTSFAAPPAACPGLIPEDAGWKLTNVRGRLGVVVATATGRVEVWVLDGGGAQPQWSRRYDDIVGVEPVAPRTSGYWVAAPQLTHGGYILRALRNWVPDHVWGFRRWGRRRLHRHKVGDLTGGGQLRAVKEPELVMLMSEEESNGDLKTFAYVETLEPVPSIHG
ncbi:hypothetical protein PAHAL_6G248100 [Panicum hallii]|jgi:F-box interacting protein|uniref:F-box domain-containing protein n=1 Tax=Panicum hallii TaxID=206008 RepID=A0A2T8IHG2_9POAL|nr:F-box protein At3g07870-like [Panicum hallii]PVH37109.1 hypothetical protein PAHAL_6G248100 [Panicum hallii]